MRFLEAMKALEEGKKVRCKGWPKSWFIHYKLGVHGAKILWNEDGSPKSFYNMRIDAEWEIYVEPEKTYSFMDILPMVKEGRKFRGKDWGGDRWLSSCDGDEGFSIRSSNGVRWSLCIEDFEANDWIEVKE